MSTTSLAFKTRAKLEMLFPLEQREKAVVLLEEKCGDGLPLIEAQGADGIERIRCAALKISNGSFDKLNEAVQLANIDWRDVLVAAGFASSTLAHLSWLEEDNHA